ncbi:MAG: FadR family transcriptional regulator [Desulfobacteraceae bacterium]|nr:MAG: FadR family transcriptional regulator [Desulfobacteraceae bacterium]
MALNIQKIKQNRRFHDVVEQLQQAIVSGELKPGESLPPEMKLKEMFSTGRGTIREALRMLEQKGLIDIRIGAGGGAFVRSIGTEKITEQLNMLIQFKKVDIDHISQFREGVEGLVAEIAATMATPEQVDHLQSILAQIKSLLEKDHAFWHKFIEIDIQLHMAIAGIAANPIYEAVIEMVHQNILGPDEPFSEKDQAILQQNYEDLEGIVDAIASHDPVRAKTLARRHVSRFKDNINVV